MKRNATSVFIVEEHNEAFFIWHKAMQLGLIRKNGNVLIHIDEHSDMSPPSLNISMKDLGVNLHDIERFTYDELGIATFIVPAVYQKMFKKVCWVKQRHHNLKVVNTRLYVRSYNQVGDKLSVGQMKDLADFTGMDDRFNNDVVGFDYCKLHIDDLGGDENVVMDIDLDYFSCVQNPLNRSLKIQITEKEYLQFTETKYHRMRYFDFGRVKAEKEAGLFYYHLNDFNREYISPLIVSEEVILERIRKVAEGLSQKNIRLSLVTICRSRFSGYTPSHQWEFIEKNLLKELSNIYDLDVKYINSA